MKRITSMLAAFALTVTSLPAFAVSAEDVTPLVGDINEDGYVDMLDGRIIMEYYSKDTALLNPYFSEDAEENARIFQLADMDSDGDITMADVTEIIDNFTVVRGDVDGNGKVDVEDAISVLTYYARKSAGLSSGVSSENDFLKRANMNKDKKIAIEDAVLILNYYAMQSSGQSVLPDVIDFKEGELNSDPQVPIYR